MTVFKKKMLHLSIIVGTISVATAIPLIALVSCGGDSGVISPDQKDVNEVVEIFDWEQDATGKQDILPQWPINQSIKIDDLGTKEPEDIKGTTITYQIAAVNQIDGEIFVWTTIRKNKASSKKILTVTKFLDGQTYFDNKINKIKPIIDKKKIETSLTDQTAREVFEKHQDRDVKFEDIGLQANNVLSPAELEDLTMKLLKLTWYSDEQGTLQVPIQLEKKFREEIWDFEENEPVIGIQDKIHEIELNIYGFKKV